jgi:Ser/Thr protein kinase RdoA (MazF antagonist)
LFAKVEGRAMQGSLGEKIGEGAAADVHEWAPGQVVKLYKPRSSRRLAWHEVQMTHNAFVAGAPAPELLGVVTRDGRLGMVLSRLDGPTLLQQLRAGAVTSVQAGSILAELCMTIHRIPAPPDAISLYAWMDAWLRSASGRLPQHLADGVRASIDRLSASDGPGNSLGPGELGHGGLCHGDLHPANVIMTVDGPRLIDWSGSIRAPAAYDLAISQTLLSEIGPEIADDPERPRALNAAVQSEYARLAGLPLETLTAVTAPYLPFIRTLIVLGESIPALRARLLERAVADLHLQDQTPRAHDTGRR